jgi:hypothetical protein
MSEGAEKLFNYIILITGFLIFIFYFYVSDSNNEGLFVLPYTSQYGYWSCAKSVFCITVPPTEFRGGLEGGVFYFTYQLLFISSWIYIRSDILKLIKLIHKKI